MKIVKVIETFAKEHPLVGPIVWILSIQYFIVQFIVAKAWKIPYSVAHNTISDLGNSACGTYAGNYVCSPRHSLMNASFMLLGVCMIIGSILLYQAINKRRATIVGFSYMAFAGLGTIIVGLFPENTTSGLHSYGAALPFFVGNLGLVILGSKLKVPRLLGLYTTLSGIIALAALLCFVSGNYLSLGAGGMERLTAYPQTVWLIVFGLYMFTKSKAYKA